MYREICCLSHCVLYSGTLQEMPFKEMAQLNILKSIKKYHSTHHQ
jgi:hypothetical protein